MTAMNNVKKTGIICLFAIFSSISVFSQTEVLYFGHTGYTAKFNNNDAPNESAFNTGGFDFFITSRLNDKLSVLGELFMGFKGDGSTLVDYNIERLYFKYEVSNNLNLRLGRQYRPMGYWNNKYTQGLVFQPTINRPYSVRNENDKGILITNSVGLQIDGEDIGNKQFSYYLMIENTSGASSINTDNTTDKALIGKLKFEPIMDLEVFASFGHDRIVAGSESIQGNPVTNDVTQSIYNAGFAYMTITSPIEAVFEYYHVINDMDNVGSSANDFMLAYFGYRINKLTPYMQLDILEFDDSDEYFLPAVRRGLVAGMRYNFTPASVLKTEYKFRSSDAIDSQSVISLQLAAVF